MKEICRCFIFLNPVKNPMFTRAILIRHDSELIRESVCACSKLLVDEESTWHKSNRGIEQKHRRILYENDRKSRIQEALLKKKKKDVILTNSIFQHVSIVLYLFSAESYFKFCIYFFFAGENAR